MKPNKEKLVRLAFLSFWVVVSISVLTGQVSIGGIVNQYSPVSSIDSSCNAIVLDDPMSLEVDDWVMIIQMQGAEIDQSDSPGFGIVQDLKSAGFYEWGQVAFVNGSTIGFKKDLVHQYDPLGKVQLIKVPTYDQVKVTSILTALPWNGTIGGVLAIRVSGTLELNEDVDVSATGFRGGTLSFGTPDCDAFGYLYADPSSRAARKGEGISISGSLMTKGRGANANGGGGGNEHNGGGGGGANLSSGGIGGDQWSGCTTLPTGGVGGRKLTSNGNRLFLGGGGGAGHQNDNIGSAGSAGGGIAIIFANNLIGNGRKIRSTGGIAQAANVDGAGGGGSGGTILLDIGSYTGNVFIQANGGAGGDNIGVPWMNHCIAPGGGGSGGVLYMTNGVLPPSVAFESFGGSSGQILTQSSMCYLTSYGAEPGEPGLWKPISEITTGHEKVVPPPLDITLSRDTICLGDTVVLTATGDGELIWSPWLENGSPFVPPLGISHYTLTQSTPLGCQFSYVVEIFVSDNPVLVTIPEFLDLCQQEYLTVYGGDFDHYLWSTSEVTPSIQISDTGVYFLLVENEFGCADQRSFLVLGCLPSLYIPDAFSPNGDGINDVFQIFGEVPKEFRIRIWDRWGELIYESTDFNSGWDGSFRGELMDPGVFVYDIEYWHEQMSFQGENLVILKSGDIHLIR